MPPFYFCSRACLHSQRGGDSAQRAHCWEGVLALELGTSEVGWSPGCGGGLALFSWELGEWQIWEAELNQHSTFILDRSPHTQGCVWLMCFQCCGSSGSGDSVFVFQGSLGRPGFPGLPGPPGLPGMKGDRVRYLAVQKVPYLEGWFLLCWETKVAFGPMEDFSRNDHRELSRKIS